MAPLRRSKRLLERAGVSGDEPQVLPLDTLQRLVRAKVPDLEVSGISSGAIRKVNRIEKPNRVAKHVARSSSSSKSSPKLKAHDTVEAVGHPDGDFAPPEQAAPIAPELTESAPADKVSRTHYPLCSSTGLRSVAVSSRYPKSCVRVSTKTMCALNVPRTLGC